MTLCLGASLFLTTACQGEQDPAATTDGGEQVAATATEETSDENKQKEEEADETRDTQTNQARAIKNTEPKSNPSKGKKKYRSPSR